MFDIMTSPPSETGPPSPTRLLGYAISAIEAAEASIQDATPGSVERTGLRPLIRRMLSILVSVDSTLIRLDGREGSWRGMGDRSQAAYEGRTSQRGIGAGGLAVDRAELLATLPAIDQALKSGALRIEHVDAIHRACALGVGRASDEVRARTALLAADQDNLATTASQLTVPQFRRHLDTIIAAADPESLERTHEQARRRRFLRFTADGPALIRIEGAIDAVAASTIRLAVESAMTPPSPDDDRTIEQRQADALSAICERSLNQPDRTTTVNIRPQLCVTIDADSYLRARGTLPPSVKSVRAPHGQLDDGVLVPRSELERLACDCELTRIILDQSSEPLDVGRSQRLFTGPRRRALIARDRGCRFPGCSMPPRWCEGHHIKQWMRDNGTTSVENGILLCSFHHHRIHAENIHITHIPDGHRFTDQAKTWRKDSLRLHARHALARHRLSPSDPGSRYLQ